jgi:hypothetical protein
MRYASFGRPTSTEAMAATHEANLSLVSNSV